MKRERLLAVAPDRRGALVADSLIGALRGAGVEGVTPESILLEMDPRWGNVEQLRDFLGTWAKSDLGLPYLHTAELFDIGTVSELADYLAKELEPPPVPGVQLPLEELGRSSGWISTGPYSGRRIGGKVALLLGVPRSGTTLCRSLLGGHRVIYAPPELHMLPFDDLGQRAEQIAENRRVWMLHGLPQALAWQLKLTLEQAYLLVESFSAQRIPIARAYEFLLKGAQSSGGEWLLDKSPSYVTSPDCLRRAEALFDGPRYVFLTRHPYSVMESLLRMRFVRLNSKSPTENPWHNAENLWLNSNRNATEFLASIPEDRKVHLRYEDLVADPGQSLSKVAGLLDVEDCWPSPFDDLASEGVLRGLGGPNHDTRRGVDPSLAERWRHSRPPQALHPQTVDLARQLGYDCP